MHFNKVTKKSLILFAVVVSIGLLVMIYPIISSKINYRKSIEKINSYSENVQKNPSKINDGLLEQAKKYNEKIADTNISHSFVEEREVSGDYLGQLNVNSDGIMGYIKIPKVDVEIPIYHGTTSSTLQKGVGHLEGSSLPIGGADTHAILSGHRGLPSSKLFTDLDQLRKNDMFYIYVLDEILAYKIDQVKIIEPSDTRDLKIIDGGDYVTLVTCTPYAINTHRLLVRGKRVKYNEKVLKDIKVSHSITVADIIFFGGLIIAALVVIYTIRKIININNSTADVEEKVIESDKDNVNLTANSFAKEINNQYQNVGVNGAFVNPVNNQYQATGNNTLSNGYQANFNRESVDNVLGQEANTQVVPGVAYSSGVNVNLNVNENAEAKCSGS